MRTAKYHDYTVLRIVLFIILVILGLFIYMNCIKAPLEHKAPDNAWVTVTEATCTDDGSRCKICTECGERFDYQTIPATGHSPLAANKENEKAHTTTEGGSYENVTYCKHCDGEISRVKVFINGEHTPDVEYTQEKIMNPTCTEFGTYEEVATCKVCNEEISREPKVVDPYGHTYQWQLNYNESDGSFAMVGECDVCDKDGSTVTYTQANGLKVTRDTSVSSCCLIRYIGHVEIDGKKHISYKDFDPDKNHSVTYYPDKDSINPSTPIVSELPEPKYDARSQRYYYDITEVDGIKEITGNVYDEYGFGRGAYKCSTCTEFECTACGDQQNHYFIVYIYNPEYDTHLYPQNGMN